MTDILQKNLGVIRDYNQELCEKISNFNVLENEIELSETLLKEPNFTYNGIPIHDINGAEKEAQNIFNKTEDSLNHVHIIYGIGLGYLFQEFAEKALGKVILYEPSVEMLRVTFEIVDFLPVLVKKNVFVASTFEDIKNIIAGVHLIGTKSKINFLNFHRENFGKEISKFAQDINTYISIVDFNRKFEAVNNDSFVWSTVNNLSKRIKAKPLSILKDAYKNVPSVIVSAGPSLYENIQKLKDIKDKVVIFSVGTAFKELIKNDIIPDFLVVIERFDTSKQFTEFADILPNVNLICEPFTAGNVLNLPFKNIFINFSNELVSNLWLAELFDEKFDEYETRGTVSYCGLNSAKILGCNPLILLGQDLAYRNGDCYSKNSVYHSLKIKYDNDLAKEVLYVENIDEYRESLYGKTEDPALINKLNDRIENKLSYLNSTLSFVDSQDGFRLPTDIAFKLYIEYFKEYAKKVGSSVNLINASIGGAQIDGYRNVALETAVPQNTSKKTKFDDVYSNILYNSDLDKIKEKLLSDIKVCQEVIKVLENAQRMVHSYKKEVERKKMMTPTSLKHLKAALNEFIFIQNNYSSKYKLIDALTLKEDKLVNKCIRESAGGGDFNSQNLVMRELEQYFINNTRKLNWAIRNLQPLIEVS